MSAITPSQAAQLDGAGEGVIYCIVGLTVQTLFFGVYTILIWLSTRMLLERRLKTTVNKVMFVITVFMYLLSAAFWIYSIADCVDRIQGLVSQAKRPGLRQPDHTKVTMWSPLINAVVAINYVLSDGVVVWRAWILCLRNHRKYLWISIFLLGCTAISVCIWIVFRIVGTAISPIVSLDETSLLGRGIDFIQVVILFASTLSNLTATGVVSATAWRHWKTIRAAFSQQKANSNRSNRILLLIVETGVFYCLVALIGLAGTLIRLPQGTLGDFYMPVNIQIAGIYPTIVLLLVSKQNSLDESAFGEDSNFNSTPHVSQPIRFASSSRPSLQSDGMSFARNPTLTVSSFTEMGYGAQSEMPERKGHSTRPSDATFV
ncbi:hypothetical protein C8F01DRAFT_226271 [Mycena amicta]|nr:hypothetical protein C8F01DRAFT_226271 [Mycena amicta]